MTSDNEVVFIDLSDDVLAELDSRIPVALEACGLEAERLAKQLCPVDTGRLRNSITHQQADDYTEEIGTNVEYAPYVEAGHSLPNGGTVPPRPFLAPALNENTDKYKSIITAYLQGNK